jgi:hypothetical protein
MVSVELRLRPATADEIEAWLPRVAEEYAADIAGSGSLPPDAAPRRFSQMADCETVAEVVSPGNFCVPKLV